jgi:hypothetical protein
MAQTTWIKTNTALFKAEDVICYVLDVGLAHEAIAVFRDGTRMIIYTNQQREKANEFLAWLLEELVAERVIINTTRF